jgi:hypothetical protein
MARAMKEGIVGAVHVHVSSLEPRELMVRPLLNIVVAVAYFFGILFCHLRSGADESSSALEFQICIDSGRHHDHANSLSIFAQEDGLRAWTTSVLTSVRV